MYYPAFACVSNIKKYYLVSSYFIARLASGKHHVASPVLVLFRSATSPYKIIILVNTMPKTAFEPGAY